MLNLFKKNREVTLVFFKNSSFSIKDKTIDNKLNFETYASLVKKTVNKKMYSIKRLFFLCQTVKLKFFKSFIMPHFDYCSTLFYYLPKSTLQKI